MHRLTTAVPLPVCEKVDILADDNPLAIESVLRSETYTNSFLQTKLLPSRDKNIINFHLPLVTVRWDDDVAVRRADSSLY